MRSIVPETDEQKTVAFIRDGLLEDGFRVTSAESAVRFDADQSLVKKTDPDSGEVYVEFEVEVSTTKTYQSTQSQEEETGVVTNTQRVRLTDSGGGNYSVTSASIINMTGESDNDVDYGDGDSSGDPEVTPEEPSDPSEEPGEGSGDDSGPAAVSDRLESGGSMAAVPAASAPADVSPVNYNTEKLDPSKMVEYAKTWTTYPNDTSMYHDGGNPAYPYVEHGCTDFVSQVLNAGGWDIQQPPYPRDYQQPGPSSRDKSLWTPYIWGKGAPSWMNKPSLTWVNAQYSHEYALHSGYEEVSDVWSLGAGDLIYLDWDKYDNAEDGVPGGNKYKIDHAMVVTSRHAGVPLITQKNPGRYNIPLHETILMARTQRDSDRIGWYPIRIRDDFRASGESES